MSTSRFPFSIGASKWFSHTNLHIHLLVTMNVRKKIQKNSQVCFFAHVKQQENCSRLTFTETGNYQMKKTYKDTLCTYEHMQEKKRGVQYKQ